MLAREGSARVRKLRQVLVVLAVDVRARALHRDVAGEGAGGGDLVRVVGVQHDAGDAEQLEHLAQGGGHPG